MTLCLSRGVVFSAHIAGFKIPLAVGWFCVAALGVNHSRSRRDVMRLSNKRSPYLFGVATANRTKVTTPNKYGAEIIARMSDWENSNLSERPLHQHTQASVCWHLMLALSKLWRVYWRTYNWCKFAKWLSVILWLALEKYLTLVTHSRWSNERRIFIMGVDEERRSLFPYWNGILGPLLFTSFIIKPVKYITVLNIFMTQENDLRHRCTVGLQVPLWI